MAANGTVDVMWEASPSITKETDVDLAEAGIVGNLKMMEGLALVVPKNKRLYRMLADGFSSYAFGFLEPRLWGVNPDSPHGMALAARIKMLHERAVTYARTWASLVVPKVLKASDKDLETLKTALKEDFDDEALEAIFWLGHTWSLLVAADTEDLENVGNLSMAEALLHRVYKSKPKYEDGGLAATFGTAQSQLGAGIGGDLKTAKAKFDEARKVTGGKYLLPDFLYGRYYCVAMLDKKCFTDAMNKVLKADPKAWPSRTLTNVLIQRWAKYWLTRTADLF